jgi:hypothetical protein
VPYHRQYYQQHLPKHHQFSTIDLSLEKTENNKRPINHNYHNNNNKASSTCSAIASSEQQLALKRRKAPGIAVGRAGAGAQLLQLPTLTGGRIVEPELVVAAGRAHWRRCAGAVDHLSIVVVGGGVCVFRLFDECGRFFFDVCV